MQESEHVGKYQVNNDQTIQGQVIGDNLTVHQHFYGTQELLVRPSIDRGTASMGLVQQAKRHKLSRRALLSSIILIGGSGLALQLVSRGVPLVPSGMATPTTGTAASTPTTKPTTAAIPTTTSTQVPSREPTLFMAWKDMNSDERLFWSSFDGLSWANQQVVGTGTSQSSFGPGLAALGNKLYLVWRVDYGGIFWSSFDGSSWTHWQVIPGVGTNSDPALAVFGNRLYLAWNGVRIYWTTFNGTSWAPQQQTNVHTTHGPALATLGNKLYMVWKGAGTDQRLWWSSFDGSSWTNQQLVDGSQILPLSSARPALAPLGSKLYLTWKGAGTDQRLWWSSFDGSSWTNQQQIPVGGTSTGPALAGFGDKVYMTWKGANTDQAIYWTTFNGTSWAPQQRMGGYTSTTPALAVW